MIGTFVKKIEALLAVCKNTIKPRNHQTLILPRNCVNLIPNGQSNQRQVLQFYDAKNENYLEKTFFLNIPQELHTQIILKHTSSICFIIHRGGTHI